MSSNHSNLQASPHPGTRITRFAVSRQPDDIYDRDSPKDVIGRGMIREYELPFLM